MNRLILFLIRRKLGVKKNQQFSFSNQICHGDRYAISYNHIYKLQYINDGYRLIKSSNLSVNFLLSSEAKEMINKYLN